MGDVSETTSYPVKTTEIGAEDAGQDQTQVLLKINVKQIFDYCFLDEGNPTTEAGKHCKKAAKAENKKSEGAQIKRSMLRLWVVDPGQISYCRVKRSWDPKSLTWQQWKQHKDSVDDCRTVNAPKKNEFVALDVTDWLRDWVSDTKSNYGLVVRSAQKNDKFRFRTNVGGKGEEAGTWPRLSMSCHGDQVAPDAVFKESSAMLKHNTPDSDKYDPLHNQKNVGPRMLDHTKYAIHSLYGNDL